MSQSINNPSPLHYQYVVLVDTNKVVQTSAQPKSAVIRSANNLLNGLLSRGGRLSLVKLGDGTQASANVAFTAAAAHGSGSSNAAFTFTAGSAGACTVTVGSYTGISVTGSGVAATDATALAAAISAALGNQAVVTTNSGDVRIVWATKGDVGNQVVTVVTATGGGKLSAAGANLTGGTPTGSLGNAVVGGQTVSLGSVASGATAAAAMVAAAALINANSVAKNYVFASGIEGQVNLVANTFPQNNALGNVITLTASVGTASGANLSGGVDASDVSVTF